jgi:hypothetical protein
MTEPHPLRCETCKREHTDHSCSCYPGWIRLSQSDKDLIEIMGCASHSSATSAEQVLDEVYEKYKHLDICLSDMGWHGAVNTSFIFDVAGELWRAIKELRQQ